MVSPRARREQVSFLRQRGLSQRHACGLLDVPRSTLGYRLRQPEKDAAALAAMHRLSAQYPRYGYRRIRIFLHREGLTIFLVEQNVHQTLKVADYCYVMENGRIVLEGTAQALRDNSDIREFYLGLNEGGARKSYRDTKHYKRRKRWLS